MKGTIMRGSGMFFGSTAMISNLRRGFSAATLALIGVTTLACTAGHSAPPPPQYYEPVPPATYSHTVKYSGETLGLISRWYTGKSSNWPLVLEANPGVRPERINLGDEILIPVELMVTEQPLPRSMLKQASSAVKTKQEVDKITHEYSEPEQPAEQRADEHAEPFVDELLSELVTPQDPEEPELGSSTAHDFIPTETVPVSDGAAADILEKGEIEEHSTTGHNRGLSDEDAERERLLDELLAQ